MKKIKNKKNQRASSNQIGCAPPVIHHVGKLIFDAKKKSEMFRKSYNQFFSDFQFFS
jgi:hypothetical protein